MKQFYTLVLMLLATVLTGSAATNMYQLNIDNADRVIVRINYEEQKDLVNGINTFTFDEMSPYGFQVSVSPVSSDYGIDKITDGLGNEVGVFGNQASFSFDSSEASHYYKITTKDLTLARTSTLNVECDKPNTLTIRFGGSYRAVAIDQESKAVKFDPTVETTIGIEHVYGENIYGFVVNDSTYADVPEQLPIKDNDKIKVTMTPPDVDYTFTITESEGGEGFVTDVKVNDVSVENVKNFVAHAGSTIQIYGNTADYNFESLSYGNNTVTYFYGSYQMTATGNTDITIVAKKLKDYDVEFDVDDPENVIIYSGYDKSNCYQLKPGKNIITFRENKYGNNVNIEKSSTGYLTSVLKNGEELYQGNNLTYIAVKENDKFVIRTEKITRDWTGVLYLDDRDKTHYVSFTSAETYMDVIKGGALTGYNTFNFGKVDNPISVGFAPKGEGVTGVLVVNDTVVAPEYQGSYTYKLTLKDKDVVKMFVAGEPEKYALSFEMPENAEGISVRRDHVKEITDFSTASTAHAGTVYHLTLPETDTYSATLGETPLTFDAENTAEFTPTADAKLTVTKAVDGIEDVTVGGQGTEEIYNLQGIRVTEKAGSLPAGIYIKGGKKVLVK